MSAVAPLPGQLRLFPEATCLIKVQPELNQHRFYALRIAPTLFGEWSLVREWGRIGCPGRLRIDMHRTEGDALNALGALERQNQRRGYQPVG